MQVVLAILVVLVWIAVAPSAIAGPLESSGEVGAVALGEGGDEGSQGAGAVRVAGHVSGGDPLSGLSLATGIDGQLERGAAAQLRGTHWVRARFDIAPTHQPDDADHRLESWVSLDHRFDYEARASLTRRHDLVRGRYTGEHLQVGAVLLGDDDPLDGGTLMPFTWDLDVVAAAGGSTDVLHRFRATMGRWWSAKDADSVPHVREVLTVDSYMHDRELQALATTMIFYAEQGRPLPVAGLLADFRIGFATSGGEATLDGQTFVNERHPDVSAGIFDGAIRLPVDRAAIELRYDRSMYLTMDSLLALEDRATLRLSWSSDRVALETNLFAARTALWRDSTMAGEHDWTDGVVARASVVRGAYTAAGAFEAGHSFYADPDADAMRPAPGWRATVDLTRRWGSAVR